MSAVLLGIAIGSASADPGDALPDPLTSAAFVREVLARHPSVASAEAAVDAAQARRRQAGALANPTARYEIAPLTPGIPRQSIAIEQAIPLGRRLGAERDQADAETAIATAAATMVRRELAGEATAAFEDAWSVQQQMEIVMHHQAVLAEMLASANRQYAAGAAPQLAVLDVQAEIAMLDVDHARMEGESREATLLLDQLLDLDPETPLPELQPTEEAPPTGTFSDRPEIGRLDQEVAAREAGLRAARAEAFPDLMLMAGYDAMWDDPASRFTVGAAIDVPLHGRVRSGRIAEAEAELSSARADRDAALDALRTGAATARARYEAAAAVLAAQRDRRLPLARERVDAARAAFAGGSAGMDEVLEAEHHLRDAEGDVAAAESQTRRALAAWRIATGADPLGDSP